MKNKFILGVDKTKNVYIPDLNRCECKILYNNVIYIAKEGDCIGHIGDIAYIVK